MRKMLARVRLAKVMLAMMILIPAGPLLAQQEEHSPPPWSAQEIESSQAQCRANITSTGIEGPKVERYCRCTSEALQARFSASDVRRMQREHQAGESNDSRSQALTSTLEQCSPVLESP